MWSLGITVIELAETTPPFHDMHPMRVLFKIPKAPPPTFNEPDKWCGRGAAMPCAHRCRSSELKDFLARCLVKEPSKRPFANELQGHAFLVGGEDRKPIRELLKLADAEIEEVLEDLSDADLQRVQAQHTAASKPSTSSLPAMEATPETPAQAPRASSPGITPREIGASDESPMQRQLTKYAITLAQASVAEGPASGDGRPKISSPLSIPVLSARPQSAPRPSLGSPATPAPYLLSQHKPSPLVASGVAKMDTSAALIQSALAPVDEQAAARAAGAGYDDRKFKTLTRTRKYITEEGETVTIKTQRIVETAAASGKVATLRRGEKTGQDWGVHDQAKLAIFRKQQLREMKMIARDEQKECSELIVRLKVERDQCVCVSLLHHHVLTRSGRRTARRGKWRRLRRTTSGS